MDFIVPNENSLTSVAGPWDVAAVPAQASPRERVVVNALPSDAPDLAHDFGIEIAAVHRHPGGFESDCLVVDGRWFVKVWHRNEPPTGLNLLDRFRSVGLPVPAPIPAKAGGLYAWWRGRPYAVFPYVPGRTARRDDWHLTAGALKRVHEVDGIELPRPPIDEPDIWPLRDHLDHPWIKNRSREVAENIGRLERVIERAAAKPVPHVICHRDFGGENLLIDAGQVVAILDWEQAILGPREHDLWTAAEGDHGELFLAEYGARDLDIDHLEYALLARALRDMAARVVTETDRPGVETWGFRRMAKLEHDLDMFRPFCS
jgi:spectinomycin phosphotransferase